MCVLGNLERHSGRLCHQSLNRRVTRFAVRCDLERCEEAVTPQTKQTAVVRIRPVLRT